MLFTNRFALVSTVSTVLVGGLLIAQSFAFDTPKKEVEPKPKNLKVLPKSTSMEDVHKIMMSFSKSLGVRCTYCHVSTPPKNPGEHPTFDMASDAKPEKATARQMMKMTADLNAKYLAKMTNISGAKVSCATCHMGSPKPLFDADSLPKKPEMKKG